MFYENCSHPERGKGGGRCNYLVQRSLSSPCGSFFSSWKQEADHHPAALQAKGPRIPL